MTVSGTRKVRRNIFLLQWYMFQHHLTGYFNSFALSTPQQSSLCFLASPPLFWAIKILGNDMNFPKIMHKAKNVVQIWKVQPSGWRTLAREGSSNASGFECQLCKQTHTCPIYMNWVGSSIAVDGPTHRMSGREVEKGSKIYCRKSNCPRQLQISIRSWRPVIWKVDPTFGSVRWWEKEKLRWTKVAVLLKNVVCFVLRVATKISIYA